MAQLFWRSRLKRRARKLEMLMPRIPADIDDNVFIALSTQAAEADKNSQSYDEFLFSEDGFGQTPYEDSVDELISLQIARAPERKSRALLELDLRLAWLRQLIDIRKSRVEKIETEASKLEAQIDEESAVLAGINSGEDGGNWSGVKPEATSISKHIFDFLKEVAILAFIAWVDYAVITATLVVILESEDEAQKFTIPAVCVQLLFPHLTGRAIAAYRSNRERNGGQFYLALGLGMVWLGFVLGLTILRMNLLQKEYSDKESESMPANLFWATLLFSLLILIGLGSWILVKAINQNPHQWRYSRLVFAWRLKENKKARAEKELARAQAQLENEIQGMEEIQKLWKLRQDSYQQLGKSAKFVYRRALANQHRDPDFTKSYLSKLANSSTRFKRGSHEE
jgi:hypothetical protein